MHKGTLDCGFEYVIDEAVTDDMRFVDAVCEMEEDNTQFSKAFRLLLGKEQRAKLYDYLDDKGIGTSFEVISGIFTEICEKVGEVKNS